MSGKVKNSYEEKLKIWIWGVIRIGWGMLKGEYCSFQKVLRVQW